MEIMAGMAESRRGKVTAENTQEARKLRAIWQATTEQRKADGSLSQEAFGLKYEIGNQAAVGFFLNGKTALSLKAARNFARGLGCNVADFSPRLAAIMGAPWPFPGIPPADWDRLSPDHKIEIQGVVRERMAAYGVETRTTAEPARRKQAGSRK